MMGSPLLLGILMTSALVAMPAPERALQAASGTSRDALIKSASAAVAAGHRAEAKELLRTAADRFQSVQALLLLARVQSGEGDAAGALDTLQKARALAPNAEDVLSALAQVSLAAHMPVPAIQTLESLVRMCPSVAQYRYLLGVGLMTAGDSLSAVGVAGESGRARSRSTADADRARSRLQQPEALPRREAAPAAQPRARSRQYRNARRARGSRSRPGRPRGRRITRRRAPSSKVPAHATANLVIGMVRIAQQRYPEARDALLAAVAADPRSPKPEYQLSLVYARLGDEATAQRHVELYRQKLRDMEQTAQGSSTAARQASSHERSARRSSVSFVGAMGLQPPAAPELLFRDITREAGITFQHHAAPEKKYIVESMSGGVALFDYDNDGLLDIYFVDSLTVDTADRSERGAQRALPQSRQRHDSRTSPTRPGVGHPGWGMGVCTADVDGDGWEDLYVTALARQSSLSKQPRRHVHRHHRAGRRPAGGWSAGCGFADYDRDGRLDLFVSRYVKIDLAHLPEFGKDKTCEYRGIAVQCGPRGLPGEGDFLFHNDGNGRFTDVSEKAGVSDPRGYFGLGVAWFDFNDDGWPDLYVANDSTPNFLYLNQKDGTFKEQAFPLGVAVSEDGAEQGSMGVAVGDYDHSGRFSLFVTNFSEEYNDLYHNDGDHFTDVSFRSKTAPSSLPFVGWGDAFFDYDNDTWPDIIAVNGHVYPQLDRLKLGASAGYRQRKLLYHNRGDGTFDEVAARYGPALMDERVSRGLAVGDLDNDGRRRCGDQRPRRRAAGPAQRAGHARQLADREACRARRRTPTPSARSSRSSPARRRQMAPRAERHELHLAGRHAAALRPRQRRGNRRDRRQVAGRNCIEAAEGEGEPGRPDRAAPVMSAWARSTGCCGRPSPPGPSTSGGDGDGLPWRR